MLDWERGLKNATAPGMPPVLLLAVPAIPAMLAAGRYLGALAPRPPYPPHVLRYHAFEAMAEIGGRRIKATLIVQEDLQHRLFLDRVLGGEARPQRDAGGANPPNSAMLPPDVGASADPGRSSIAAPPPAPTATVAAATDNGNPPAAASAPDETPSPPASIPLSDIQKPIQFRDADYEAMGARLRYLNGKYDPQSWGDQIASAFTGGLNDPSRVMTDSERAERQALKDRLNQVINDHYNPQPTPDEARLDAIASSPLGTAASLVERAFGASQQTQDATIGAGGALEGMGMAALGPRPMLGPLPNAPMTEAARSVETKPPMEYRAPPPAPPDASPSQPATVESPEPSTELAGDKPNDLPPPPPPGGRLRPSFPGDFPDIVVQRAQDSPVRPRAHPDYRAAKAGDPDAAERLINDTIDPEKVKQIGDVIGDRRPVIVAVHGIEATGRNKIPQAYAATLARRLGLDVDDSIVQANRPQRTGKSPLCRVIIPSEFAGPVQSGQDYLIVDDHVTQGGTLADLRGYIQSKGGNVVGATSLTANPGSEILAPRPETLATLRQNVPGLEDWWKETYGHDFQGLTEGEARYLLQYNSAQSVRNQIAARGQAPSVNSDKGAARPPQSGSGEKGTGRDVEGDEGRRAGGAAPHAAHISGHELEMPPRSYGHLVMLTARYARVRLDGHTVVNYETRAPIALTWECGLREFGAPGTSVEMLRAVPAIPVMLAGARYLGSAPDPLRRPDIAKVHGFASAVEIGGRRIDVLMVVRENRQERLFLDRVERRAVVGARAA
jgi:hypothetical protein